MHKEEYNPAHFRWTMVDNSSQSVYAFERDFGDEVMLFVFNMTPNYYDSYDVGTYQEGEFEEIFNSDKDVYGGYNNYNGDKKHTYPGGPEDRPYHINIKLASFGACFFLLSKKDNSPIINELKVAKKAKSTPKKTKTVKKTKKTSTKRSK